MGCNCKKDSNINDLIGEAKTEPIAGVIIKYILKTLGFIFLLILLPVINIYIIWLMFDMLILNRNVDIKPALLALGRKFELKNFDDEDEELTEQEFLELTEDDVVLMNSEELIKKT